MDLKEIIVGDISGKFVIEAYQRGYRWSDDEINHLLADIEELADNQDYCLQPIVVKDCDGVIELIDGQQRLTTLYLIMRYLAVYIDTKYSIEYTTRKSENGKLGSRELLERIDKIDLNAPSSNIDEFFIKKAYGLIQEWFKGDKTRMRRFAGKLEDHVKIIWYEVDKDEDSVKIFTRLNIGKISLTNAELVKALFLSRGRKDDKGRYSGNPYGINDKDQHEIALTWDSMEKELHDENFWAFITNEKAEKYPIRMELLFNMIETEEEQNNSFATFNSFYKRFKDSDDKIEVWGTIVRYFQQLQEWYKDFDLYHQIGFLVAFGTSVKDLLEMSMNKESPMKKSEFRDTILTQIREIMTFRKKIPNGEGEIIDYDDLNYEAHPEWIKMVLLLFNVETIRQKGDRNSRFPFDSYKRQGVWSLEHIHAQNSESLKTVEDWRTWLEIHRKSLESLLDDPSIEEGKRGKITPAIEEIDKVLSHMKGTKNISIREEFNVAAKLVVDILSDGDDMMHMHALPNMALLTVGENAALSNSTFDVKRVKILEMDRRSDYIPVCTKNVFMKYYSSSDTKLHFWSEEDRINYVQAMNDVLYNHLGTDNKPLKLIHTELHYGNR